MSTRHRHLNSFISNLLRKLCINAVDDTYIRKILLTDHGRWFEPKNGGAATARKLPPMVLQTRGLDLALPPSPSPTWILCHHEAHLKVGRALHRKQTDLAQPFGISTAACADLAAFVEINF